jgi:hypothetical protein
LNFQKVPLDEVLTEITKQTNFTFAYSQPVIDPKTEVSIDVKDIELQQALDKLLAGTVIAYEMGDKKVLLFSRPQAPGQSSSGRTSIMLNKNNINLIYRHTRIKKG